MKSWGGIVIATIVVLLGIFASRYAPESVEQLLALWKSDTEDAIVISEQTLEYRTGFQHIIKSNGGDIDPSFRVAVGLNGNLDLIVRAIPLLKSLGIAAPADTNRPQDKVVDTDKQLAETFAHFFIQGAAGERSVDNHQFYKLLISKARSLKYGQWQIGGNAALIAENLAANTSVLLGAKVGPNLRDKLNPQIQLCELCETGSDEIHLILEYEKGETWDHLTSPRANRFILSRDITNAHMESLQPFRVSLEQFQPHVVVLSGFHLLSSVHRLDVRDDLLLDAQQLLGDLDECTPAHMELASIGEPDLVRLLIKQIAPRVDSIGLNEQELKGLVDSFGNALVATPPSIESITNPSIPFVAQLITSFFQHVGKSRLSRLHFHSLKFHMIAQIQGAWNSSRSMAAVAQGTLTTSTKACNFHDSHMLIDPKFTINNHHYEFSPSSPVLQWVDSSVSLQFFVAPVMVCRKPVRTVGLGDSISAAGLLYSRRMCGPN